MPMHCHFLCQQYSFFISWFFQKHWASAQWSSYQRLISVHNIFANLRIGCVQHCVCDMHRLLKKNFYLYELFKLRKEVESHGQRACDFHRLYHADLYLCYSHSLHPACTLEFMIRCTFRKNLALAASTDIFHQYMWSKKKNSVRLGDGRTRTILD